MARVRCAIYTRKSSEDGLEQDFNSLDAQREACAAFIASQKAEGWVLLPERYDDGGLSGGTLERPALQRLMGDLEAGKVDQIVVYKIDRLTRSLADFAKLVERLDAAGASFVSVTQSFNTATSMGRLTLNVLLSFAQFEREVTAERIRDKIAASKRRGPLDGRAGALRLRCRRTHAEDPRGRGGGGAPALRALPAPRHRAGGACGGAAARVSQPGADAGERQDGRRRQLLARAHPSDAEQSALCRPHPAQARSCTTASIRRSSLPISGRRCRPALPRTPRGSVARATAASAHPSPASSSTRPATG